MSRALSMQGHIDSTFRSTSGNARHHPKGGAYVDGLWVAQTFPSVDFPANIQPLNDKEIDFLPQGGERIIDSRKIYINSGNMEAIQLDGEWEFLGQRWKIARTDNRPWNNYCKVIVYRIDK